MTPEEQIAELESQLHVAKALNISFSKMVQSQVEAIELLTASVEDNGSKIDQLRKIIAIQLGQIRKLEDGKGERK